MAGFPIPHNLEIQYYLNNILLSEAQFTNCEGNVEQRYLDLYSNYEFYFDSQCTIPVIVDDLYESHMKDLGYIDTYGLVFYLKDSTRKFSHGITYIYTNGEFKRAKPIIVKTTNMGPIPMEALMTNEGIPYLTKNKQFILTTGSKNLTNSTLIDLPLVDEKNRQLFNENNILLTELGTSDFILYEFFTYTPKIIY